MAALVIPANDAEDRAHDEHNQRLLDAFMAGQRALEGARNPFPFSDEEYREWDRGYRLRGEAA